MKEKAILVHIAKMYVGLPEYLFLGELVSGAPPYQLRDNWIRRLLYKEKILEMNDKGVAVLAKEYR